MNFKKMISKNKSRKNASSRRGRTHTKKQRGGVGFRPDVFNGQKIGGLPVINATSDCPNKVGPGSKKFPKALYGGNKKSRKSSTTRRRRKDKK